MDATEIIIVKEQTEQTKVGKKNILKSFRKANRKTEFNLVSTHCAQDVN